MLVRLFSSRGFLSFGSLVLAALLAAAGFQLLRPTPEMRAYCAEMPDAIGLFEGSAVTVMGVRVGSVTAVRNSGATARVEFEIAASRKLPPDVGATTLADALVANRKIALIGAEPEGPGWDSRTCITKTATPKSLSQTLTALATLAQQLNGAGAEGGPGTIGRGLSALNSMSAGTGDDINALIAQLGAALNSPDAAIANLGRLMDSLSALSRSAAVNWPDIKTTIIGVGQLLDNIANIAVPPVLEIFRRLVDVLPALNDVTVTLGGPLVRRLDQVENLPQLIQAGVGSLREIIGLTPALASAFSDAVDPATKAVRLAYAPPRVAVPAADAAQVCAAINALAAGECVNSSDGLVNVALAQLILGSVGAR